MKALTCILTISLALHQTAVAQDFIVDSIQLQQVNIQAIKSRLYPSQNQLELDSLALSNTTTGSLADVISQNTGIFVKSYGQGSLSTVSFRGSGASHTGIYWNGFSMNSAMNGQVDLSLLPSAFYDKVLVDYGSSSMQYGAGGLGGSIQMLSQPDFGSKLNAELHQSVGSFSRYGSFGKVEIANTKWQSSTKIYRQSAENDFEYLNLGKEAFPMEKQKNADFLQYGVMQGIYFRPRENQLLKLDAWYMNTDRNIPSIMTVNDRNENQQDESIRAVVSFLSYYANSTLELGSNYQYELLEYSNEMMQEYSRTYTYSLKNMIKYQHKISERLNLKTRLDLDRESISTEVYSLEKSRLRQAMYVSAAYDINKTFLEAFVREEWLNGEEVYFLPGLAISQQLGNTQWLLRTSIAENMKQPTLNDLYWIPAGNPELKAESSRNFDLGITNKNLIDKSFLKASFSLNAFHYNIKDYIQWLPSSFGYWRAENLKEIQSKGLELKVNIDMKWNRSKLQLDGNYSYTSSTNQKALQADDESVGKQLFYVPMHLFNSHLRFYRKDSWLELTYQYTGLRYTSSDNSEFLPAYALLNLKIGKQIQYAENSWSIELSVDNILDQSYQAILWRPMPGRSYTATLKYSFKK